MRFHLLGFVIFTLFQKTGARQFKDSPRYCLLNALFGNNTYGITRNVLPLPRNHSPVRVCFHLHIHKILELNEKKQVMNLNIWLRVRWKNPYLEWNPNDYNGVESITVEKEKIWVPDLTLWNRAVNDASMYKRLDTKILIMYDGTCVWKAPVATSSTCKIQVKHFPFDNQNCSLNFGSWRHPSSEIILSMCNRSCVNREHYRESSEWSLHSAYGLLADAYFNGTKFSSITCGFEVNRRPMFYIIHMIVPCTIITLLSCLTFYLPANNGERTTLVITVLLAMTVYMLMASEIMPHTSDSVPLVQRFYLLTIIETALCLLSSCIVVKWHENTASMPNWVYIVFNCGLRKLLRVQHVDQAAAKDHQRSSSSKNSAEGFALHCCNSLEETTPDAAEHSGTAKSAGNANSMMKFNAKVRPRDWHLAAKVLNKLFFIVFIVLFLFTIIFTFAGFIF